MALLNPLYTAPLPVDFVSGIVEIKSQTQYVDSAGRVNQPYTRYRINADRTLTNLQTGGGGIVGMGIGDAATAAPLDVVTTITVAGSTVPPRISVVTA